MAFDRWLATTGGGVPVTADDFVRARSYVRISRSGLRSADALHLAVVERLGLTLATFDTVMRRTALDLGLPVFEA
jgi:predicted nucleic acid-binding protein